MVLLLAERLDLPSLLGLTLQEEEAAKVDLQELAGRRGDTFPVGRTVAGVPSVCARPGPRPGATPRPGPAGRTPTGGWEGREVYHHSGDWEGREVYHHWWLGGQGGVSSLRVQGSQPDTEVCPGGKAVSGLGAPGILTGTGRLVQYKQVFGGNSRYIQNRKW